MSTKSLNKCVQCGAETTRRKFCSQECVNKNRKQNPSRSLSKVKQAQANHLGFMLGRVSILPELIMNLDKDIFSARPDQREELLRKKHELVKELHAAYKAVEKELGDD